MRPVPCAAISKIGLFGIFEMASDLLSCNLWTQYPVLRLNKYLKEDKIMETAKVRTGQRALLRVTVDIVHNSASIG